MRSVKHIFLLTVEFLFLFFLSVLPLMAGGGHGDEGELTQKVSTEGLEGFNLWFVNLYNDDRLIFALVTLVIMGLVGITIAFVTEFFLKMFGLEVSKIEHKE